MKFKPHPYQQQVIQHIVGRRYVGAFLQMGLGKTACVLAALQELFAQQAIKRVLVIAPLRVAQHTWPAEFAKWDSPIRYAVACGSAKQRLAALAQDAPVTLINRENLPWLIEQGEWCWDMVVVDESTSFKNPASQRFKALRKVRKESLHRVVLLSGSPSPNGLEDLWSQVFLLDEGKRLETSVTKYRARYFDRDWSGYGWTPKPTSAAVVQSKIADICFSLQADDYLQMPELIENTITLPLPEPVRDVYAQMLEELIAELDNGTVIAPNAAAKINKLRQICNGFLYDTETGAVTDLHSAKLDTLADILEDNRDPLLLFYQFRRDEERLLQRFPFAVKLNGNAELEAWNRGEIRLMIAHPRSAGHGLNLQHGGNSLLWFGVDYDLDCWQQAIARLYRQGQQAQTVINHVLVVEHSIEQVILDVLRAKDGSQSALLNAIKLLKQE